MDEELVIEACESDEEEEVEKKFITSPADVETQRKIKLQDANITEIDKARFRSLCNEFEDIFSKSSEDIGHTPLVTMDIDTGDSPPVCQKPYSLPLKRGMGTKRTGNIRKGRGNPKRHVPMGKPNSNSS